MRDEIPVKSRRQHVLPALAVLLAATVGVLVHVTFVAQDLEQEYVQAEANIATTARVRSRITRRSGSRQRADAEQRTESGQTEMVRGTVVSRLDGSPICGAVVRMGAGRTTTDTGGRFEMRIQWTDGELEVAADGFRTVRVPAHELRSYPKGIPLQLGPGGAVGGRVLDEAGQAVAEAKVSVGGTRFPTEVVKTDADGRFVAKGVPIGDFMVRADPPADRLLLPAVAESIPTGSVDVVLVCRRGSALRGTVLSPDGTPVADARVTARPSARPRVASPGPSVRTDTDGRFALVLDGSERHTIVVTTERSDGGGSLFAPVEIRECGVENDLRIVLKTGGTLRGSVVCNGTPCAELRLEARPVHGDGGTLWTTTGSDGSFVFTGLAGDLWSLEVGAVGAPPRVPRKALLNASALRRDQPPVTLELTASHTLCAAVEDVCGVRLRNRPLRLVRVDGGFERRVATRADGIVALGDVPVGAYRIDVELQSGAGNASFEECGIVHVPGAPDRTLRFSRCLCNGTHHSDPPPAEAR